MRIIEPHIFWANVKKLTRAHKMSQEKQASVIEVSYGTLKHWMCYGLLPDIETAFNIADVFGVTVESLVMG